MNEEIRIVCNIVKSYTGIAREFKNFFDSFVGILHVFAIIKGLSITSMREMNVVLPALTLRPKLFRPAFISNC